MATATVTLGADFFDALAEAVARRALAGAEIIAGPSGGNPVPPPPPPSEDPWDSAPAPASPLSPPSAPAQQQGTHNVQTPKGQQTWQLGRSDAPACGCGNPAAKVSGSTNGRQWNHWRCAKGMSQDTWRGKCDFGQWV